MNVIVILDDKNGMMFNKRRQSKDQILLSHILKIIEERQIAASESECPVLWMNSYTAKLFDPYPEYCRTDDDFLTKAGQKDFCLVENQHLSPCRGSIQELYIYRWNRHYPGDFFFDINLKDDIWQLMESEEFAGNSHKKITLEHYVSSCENRKGRAG